MPLDVKQSQISVIIPALHEQETINTTLKHVRGLPGGQDCEVVVVDGDPQGNTLAAIRDPRVVRLTSAPGRGRQMNVGARSARGTILIFLHADTQLPLTALSRIVTTMADDRYMVGAFRLGIDSSRWILRYIAFRANMRTRTNRIPYGDQAIFMTKDTFGRLGGYAELPMLEDVDLMRRVKRQGGRLCILPERVQTSPRRWEAEGALYTTLRNQVIMLLYYLGVKPARLAKLYRPQNEL